MRSLLLVFLIFLGFLGCGRHPTYTPSKHPAAIVSVSGDNQFGPINQPLPNPLVVRVFDTFNHPVDKAQIAVFFPLRGVPLQFATTDQQGVASCFVTPFAKGPCGIWVYVWTDISLVTTFTINGY